MASAESRLGISIDHDHSSARWISPVALGLFVHGLRDAAPAPGCQSRTQKGPMVSVWPLMLVVQLRLWLSPSFTVAELKASLQHFPVCWAMKAFDWNRQVERSV